jgi:hypothetical protein
MRVLRTGAYGFARNSDRGGRGLLARLYFVRPIADSNES